MGATVRTGVGALLLLPPGVGALLFLPPGVGALLFLPPGVGALLFLPPGVGALLFLPFDLEGVGLGVGEPPTLPLPLDLVLGAGVGDGGEGGEGGPLVQQHPQFLKLPRKQSLVPGEQNLAVAEDQYSVDEPSSKAGYGLQELPGGARGVGH